MSTGEFTLIILCAASKSYDSSRFVPFQGLRLVDQVQTGVIVDFTVAKKDFQSDHINIYVIEGDKKASMYKLYTKDNVPTLSLKHGYYQ